MTDIADRVRKIDIVYSRKMIRNEDIFDEFFELQAFSSRQDFVLSARSRAKNGKINDQFAWKVTRVINESVSTD